MVRWTGEVGFSEDLICQGSRYHGTGLELAKILCLLHTTIADNHSSICSEHYVHVTNITLASNLLSIKLAGIVHSASPSYLMIGTGYLLEY